MNRLIQFRQSTALFLIILLPACFALPQRTRAVSPAPDGGYPGGNTAEGQNALLQLTTGGFNTAVGYLSLRSNTTNSFNTALGAGALLANTADSNTATGAGALLSNTTGSDNAANGAFALFSNTGGDDNTATGDSALFSNTTASHNTATGYQALLTNSTGSENTADGVNALAFNTIGENDTASGFDALFGNTTGSGNTATGNNALFSNTTGFANTAIGSEALFNNTGSGNTALGAGAGSNVITAAHVICIGIPGEDVSNSCFIGNIYGETTMSGTTLPVIVSNTGQLGTAPSAARFKKEIKPMDRASESILALRPVTFHYKSDTKGTPQFGLVAEEVAAVNPDLIVRDKNGEIYTVRYDAVNAMLLNEFLKEHRTVNELKAMVAQQQKQVEALTAGLQKVSAELELNKAAPQTVLNGN
jgi:Chaperone of endosialidase